MTTSTICFRDVSVSLGGARILSSVSFEAFPGRVHVLLGANGAGKSTLLKTLVGLVPTDGGSVFINGRPFDRTMLRLVGASINEPALYPHLSAVENIYVHCLALNVPKSEGQRCLSVVGLVDTGKKKVRSFSTGMKARLALAIAFLGNPEILLLDEPQNGLDPHGIVELRQLLQNYAEARKTVIVSSHQLGEVTRLAHDITIIANGSVLYSGAAAQLVNDDLESVYLRLLEGGEH